MFRPKRRATAPTCWSRSLSARMAGSTGSRRRTSTERTRRISRLSWSTDLDRRKVRCNTLEPRRTLFLCPGTSLRTTVDPTSPTTSWRCRITEQITGDRRPDTVPERATPRRGSPRARSTCSECAQRTCTAYLNPWRANQLLPRVLTIHPMRPANRRYLATPPTAVACCGMHHSTLVESLSLVRYLV